MVVSRLMLVFFQILADIFNLPVYTIDVPNSSALGGCYRAKLGDYFHISIKRLLQHKMCCSVEFLLSLHTHVLVKQVKLHTHRFKCYKN